MANWVQAGNRKINLDQAAYIDRTDDGDVYVIFDGALNHRFSGLAAEAVWKMIAARDTDALLSKALGGAPRTRRRAKAG